MRKLRFHRVLALGVLLSVVLSLCAQTNSVHPPPHLEWDRHTLQLIQTNGQYARIIRLQDGHWVCGFDYHGKIWVRHSSDNGKTWLDRVEVSESPFAWLTNTELLQLRDGTLLCFYDERPHAPIGEARQTSAQPEPPHRFAIRMARSVDGGRTWRAPETLYSAGAEFTNGCWEPAAIQLPSGEVQVFFANEGPYRESDEQEITLLRSKDSAHTWKTPQRVSFRPGHRDGMPVPLVLDHDGGIAFAIEDNGLSGNFKPVIVFSSLMDNWRSGTRGPESTNRWSALRMLPEPHVAGSAPYLRQMPSGETLLSFQRTDTGEMKDAYAIVCIGGAQAKNFDTPTRPFAGIDAHRQVWNSLFIKDKSTVLAVSETRINGVHGIWTIEGRFVR